MEETITYHIKKGVPRKECPKTIEVFERKNYKGFTGRIGIYELEKFKRKSYQDCYDVVYKLIGEK